MNFRGKDENSERFFRAMLQLSNVPILITDAKAKDNPIVYVNPAFERVTGYDAVEVIGRNCRLLQEEDREQPGRAIVKDAIKTGSPCEVLFRNYRKNGQLFWTQLYMFPVTDQGGVITHFVGIQHDVTAREEHETALVYAATHDPLTELPNRSACIAALTRRLRICAETGEDVAAVFIDLDHFKDFNDAFGHAAGDKVLEQIGARLIRFASDTCLPARISGDEFVVIVTGSDETHTRALAGQLLDAIATPINLNGRDITVGASIGIALAHGTTVTPDELLSRADTAMYRAKANRRHSVSVYDGGMNDWNCRRHRLRQDMLQALESGQFLLHYQPQVSLQDGSVVGAEALVRWQHPEFGLLSPSAFLDIAEESPLIIEMGAWVFNESCRQLRQWEDEGLSIKMSVNVSARQLASRDLPEMMAQAIRRHGVRANSMKLEVTESMLAQDFEATSQVLASLKQKGFRIALDDFGTGYSNLAYISRLPVTAIKIDRSFVTALAVDESALPLIKGIVALAKSLNLHVVCEGIETTEQREVLEGTECDSIQGYLIGRPVSAETFYATHGHARRLAELGDTAAHMLDVPRRRPDLIP